MNLTRRRSVLDGCRRLALLQQQVDHRLDVCGVEVGVGRHRMGRRQITLDDITLWFKQTFAQVFFNSSRGSTVVLAGDSFSGQRSSLIMVRAEDAACAGGLQCMAGSAVIFTIDGDAAFDQRHIDRLGLGFSGVRCAGAYKGHSEQKHSCKTQHVSFLDCSKTPLNERAVLSLLDYFRGESETLP
jgi:hypothetical protein